MDSGEKNLLRAMLEAIGDGIFTVDHTGVCTFINHTAASMLGYLPEELLGRELHPIIHHTRPNGEPYPVHECPVRASLKTGESLDVTGDMLWKKDGTAMPIDCQIRPFLPGTDQAGVMITVHDLTERTRFEAALHERGKVADLTSEIAVGVTRGDNLSEMLKLCTDTIVRHLDAAFARVWTLDEAGTTLELQASSGIYTHINGGHARVPVGKFKIGWIAEHKVPHLTNDVETDPRVGDHEWAKQMGLKSFSGYPLIVDGEMLGVVALFARRVLRDDTLVSLGSVANSIALGIRRKRIEEEIRNSEARNKAILETSQDCVVMVDGESRILEWNPAAETTFGYTREEILGKQLPEAIIPPSLREQHRVGMLRYLATGKGPVIGTRIEITGMHASGREFPVELAVNRIDITGRILFTATLRDITDRKHAQEELRQAKDAAEAASHAKSNFLANMSHELRTPLNAILGYSEMLLEEANDSENPTMAKDLTRINSAGKHLLALIGDILDLSKIDAGKMDLYPETFSVEVLVRDVASTVEALMKHNSNQLEVKIEPDVGSMFADMTKVRQNLFNLLSNAAKFTKSGTVTLTASAAGDDLVFAVADTGLGIPQDRMDLLFQPFMQVDKSTTRDFGGTGLGLAITQKFSEMMGGDITVESELGRGSTFTMKLPRRYTPKEETAKEDLTEQVSASASDLVTPGSCDLVLVIDDDAAARDLIHRNLKRSGLQAVLASSGEEGLRIARELRPTVITLDVLMPGMDGWAVLQELKSDPELSDIPVVMATMVADRTLGYSLGASDYLMKPITRERLQSTLSRYKCDPPPCTVLLVEDDTDSRDLLEIMLKREGWDVMLAADGLEALARMEDRIPTVILLDLMMPNMDGFEFATHLNQREEWRKIPVLVVTAKDLTDEERARLNGHVERILNKNALAIDELLREVRNSVSACLLKKAPDRAEPQDTIGTI